MTVADPGFDLGGGVGVLSTGGGGEESVDGWSISYFSACLWHISITIRILFKMHGERNKMRQFNVWG